MTIHITRRSLLAGMAATVCLPAAGAHSAAPTTLTLTLTAADGRQIPVNAWPAHAPHRGVIFFSHGALSAPRYYDALIQPAAAAGYDVYAPLHVDSAEHPLTSRYPGLASWKARLEDMRALAAHLGEQPYVAMGHSYGALVALTLGGAAAVRPEGYAGPMHDPRVKAVVAFSPPAPVPALIEARGYGTLVTPALIQTGTRDILPGMENNPDAWRGHLAAYDNAAGGGNRYALVLEGVDHYFGGAICRLDLAGPRQNDQLARATAMAALFLKAFGSGDEAARQELDRQLAATGPVQLRVK